MTHVLVTRPLDTSRQLAGDLDAHGLTPIVMPLYTFSPIHPLVNLDSVLSQDGIRKLVIFTSPRAVEFGLEAVPPRDQLEGLEIAVIGSSTGAALEARGYPVHIQARTGFTSEDFLQIPGLQENAGDAVIFCAPGGRMTIAEGMDRLGWKVTRAMVYERVPLEPGATQIDELRDCDGLLSIWTSISALKLAEQYLPADVWGKILGSTVLVISTRIQHYLEQMGAGSVELAIGPGNPDLLQSVLQLTGQQTTG